MLTTIEDLASKLDISNQNTRELLTKLAIWSDSSTSGNVNINLRNENSSYITTYSIPCLNDMTDTIKSATSDAKVAVKNWGSFVDNEDLSNGVYLDSNSPKINYVRFNGTPSDKINFILSLANVDDSFDFICTVDLEYADILEVITFTDTTGKLISSVYNTASSDISFEGVNSLANTITVKVSLRCCLNTLGSPEWFVFDYHTLPSFKFNGVDGFEYSQPYTVP
jgi:hypothetical protein